MLTINKYTPPKRGRGSPPPGLYQMDGATFQKCAAMSISSTNIVIEQSPAHVHDRTINKQRYWTDKEAQILGRVIHCLMFEPDELDNRFFVLPPKFERRSKAGKVRYNNLVKQYGANHLIKSDMVDKALAIVNSIKSRPATAQLFTGGVSEVGMFWIDPTTGGKCKARVDYISPVYHDDGALTGIMATDLKSVETSRRSNLISAFKYSVSNYNYHRQAAFIIDGLSELYPKVDISFWFAAVEKTAPWFSCAFKLSSDAIDQGRDEYLRGITEYKKCLDRREWPAYPDIVEIDLEAWKRKQWEDSKDDEDPTGIMRSENWEC